jgi:hypothetical protein
MSWVVPYDIVVLKLECVDFVFIAPSTTGWLFAGAMRVMTDDDDDQDRALRFGAVFMHF